MKPKKKVSLALLRAIAQSGGKASNYISKIDELKPGDRVVICCRVSSHTQAKTMNLDDQEFFLRESLQDRGIKVVDCVRHIGSCDWPYWISPAVKIAKENNASLVAETTNRFVRHPRFHSNDNPAVQARKTELEDLMRWADGIQLFTVLDPDATPSEEKRQQTQRGISAKGGKPKSMKPRGKERREEYFRLAMRFRKRGASYRQIAEILNSIDDDYPSVSYRTIGNWLKHR